MKKKILFATFFLLHFYFVGQSQDTILVQLTNDTIHEGLRCGVFSLGKNNYQFCLTDLNMNGTLCELEEDGMAIRNFITNEMTSTFLNAKNIFQAEDSILYNIDILDCNQAKIYHNNSISLNKPNLALRGRIVDMVFQNAYTSKPFSLFSYLSDKEYDYVILTFWTPKMDLQELDYFELYTKQSRLKIAFVNLCWDHEMEAAKPILTRSKLPGVHGICTGTQIDYLNVVGMPFCLLYDKSGVLARVAYGPNLILNYLSKIESNEK